LDNADDDPEFYKRGTLVDVPYGAGQEGLFTSTYAQPVSRVRWEITEDALNARLAYERISGTDKNGTRYDGVQQKASPINDGQIVASYKVVSHFDIKREYNPQTGEQLNIVSENTSDRPWFQREQFRVDWSKNLVNTAYDYDTLTMLGIIGGVTYEPFAYTVLDPNSPDAPHFDAAAGYFDVTNKVYAKPALVDLAAFGESGTIPACFLSGARVTGGTDPVGDCNPVQLTIRESYRKVVDTDYEPENFDGVRFQSLGAFNSDYRRGYARNYGLLDSEWSRFIARYNIWEKSHFYADAANPAGATGAIACATKATTQDPTGDPKADPNRDNNGNGTADECEQAGSGSRCDLFTQKCTLPYRERTARVIPWHIAGDVSLFEATNWAVLEWDLAMRTAVMTARLTECRRTKGASCDASYPMWKGQQDDIDEATRIARLVDACHRDKGWASPGPCDDVATAEARAVATERGNAGDASAAGIAAVLKLAPVIVLCHNPVLDKDHPTCGKPGLAVRTGDIRYNVVNNIATPQVPSPWGILADGNDPLTGEKVVGSMNVWTAITDIGAQALVDIVRYINGELTTGEITNGTYVQNWAAAAKLSAASALPTLSKEEVNRRLAATTALTPKAFGSLTAGTQPQEIQAIRAAGRAVVADVQARNDIPSPATTKLHATLNLMRGTPVENQLINPAMLQLAGAPRTTSLSGGVPAAISPLALNNPLLTSRLHQMRETGLAARGSCVIDEAPEPSSLTGLASILAKKFPRDAKETTVAQKTRYDRMFRYVQQRYHYAVLAHEMGHSIGLRHNFVSSSAALFYRPQYWQLRTKNGKVTAPCTDAVSDGATCTGPRYFDPLTDEEQSQLIWMWMHSTVMDYPGDVSQDFLGLGVSDFASARFFYGDTVSVYDSPDYKAGTSIGVGVAQATDTFGGLLGIRYGLKPAAGTGLDEFHYSQLQNNYHVINGCMPVKPAAPAGWNEMADGVWDPVLDGRVVAVDGQFTKCRQQPVDYVGYTQLRPATALEASGTYQGGPNVEPATGRLRVPYAFATDHWADTGNVSVFRHDNGADPYEQVQFLISTQENRHIFDNYRRNRSNFSLISATQRSFDRYMSKIQGITSGMSFFASIYQDLATNQGYAFDTL
ncbi:MAG TPA: zinc-dependent metalloprotease, partial [Polyangia bacterium]|nr:zinc-dependent metalloprotease [Polyangia bacterium]